MNAKLKPTARKSLPLTAQDVADLAALRESEAHRDALQALSGAAVTTTDSEASLLHSVLVAGLRVVRERAEEAGYAQMAAERNVQQDRAFARRRRPSWAEE